MKYIATSTELISIRIIQMETHKWHARIPFNIVVDDLPADSSSSSSSSLVPPDESPSEGSDSGRATILLAIETATDCWSGSVRSTSNSMSANTSADIPEKSSSGGGGGGATSEVTEVSSLAGWPADRNRRVQGNVLIRLSYTLGGKRMSLSKIYSLFWANQR